MTANSPGAAPVRPRKYLVTGGAGYVGSVVAAHLLEAGHAVTVLDDLSTGFRQAVPDGAEFVEGRVQDAARVLSASPASVGQAPASVKQAPASGGQAPGFDGVLHFAAHSQVGESVQNPEKYWRNNLGGTIELLTAMREAGVARLVFSSTAATYGEPLRTPIHEDAFEAPTNPYGASKLAVDHMISGWCRAYGASAVSLRYFNVAGAYDSYGELHDPESHLIPLVFQVVQGRREAISVFGDDYPTPDGTCVRDYIHVGDLAEAHLLAMDAMTGENSEAAQGGRVAPGEHLICNLGNGNGFSVREVVETVRKVTGHAVPETVAPRRDGDPAELVASADRARERLGWRPSRTSLAEIVQDAWEFAQKHAPQPGDA